MTTENISAWHSQALSSLHSEMAADKSLYNLQLAVTHMSFILNHDSNQMV